MSIRVLAGILLAVAAVAYSAWLLVFFLPTGLSLVHAYVSELSADDQPYRWLFRATDAVAGLALLASVPVLWRVLPDGWSTRLLVLGLVTFGLSVLAGAVFSLDCASSLSAQCRRHESSGPVSVADTMHVVSSVASDCGIFVAAIGAERLATGLPRLALRAATGLIAATGLGIVALNFLGPGHYGGLVLEVQLVTVAVVLAVAAFQLFRAREGARRLEPPLPLTTGR
jgi:hypothetical protein